jgi:GntR family transcriptional regulator
MLGVSRGTLRTALQRLEVGGEIVRRQGSGTFVGRVATPTAFVEGLERLEPYSMLARRRGVKLGVRDVEIELREIGPEVGGKFDLPADTEVAHVSRIVLAGGEAAAHMTDVVHPDIDLPSPAALRRAFERGEMIMDVLLAQGVPIAFATTRVLPRMITPREHVGQLFGVSRTTAVLELEETIHVTSGEVVHHSRDLFGPGGMDLPVVRALDVERPAQVNPAASENGPARRRGGHGSGARR